MRHQVDGAARSAATVLACAASLRPGATAPVRQRHAEHLGDDAKRSRCHTMHVAVGDVERLVRAAGSSAAHKIARASRSASVACVMHGAPPGNRNGSPRSRCTAARTPSALHHVHRAAERKTADDLRPHDRIRPAPTRAQLRSGGLPDSNRNSRPGWRGSRSRPGNAHRRDVRAVRLRALQQRHVAQRRLRAEHFERVDEHRGVRRRSVRDRASRRSSSGFSYSAA